MKRQFNQLNRISGTSNARGLRAAFGRSLGLGRCAFSPSELTSIRPFNLHSTVGLRWLSDATGHAYMFVGEKLNNDQ